MGTRKTIPIGKPYDLLTVIGVSEPDSAGKSTSVCECDCGEVVVVRNADLKGQNTKSCGCDGRERACGNWWLCLRAIPDAEGYYAGINGSIWSQHAIHKRFKFDRPVRCGMEGTNSEGYVQVSVNNVNRQVHQLVWAAFNGPIPAGLDVDHENGDRSDNRPKNLRIGTPSENCRNKTSRANSSSRFKGIYPRKNKSPDHDGRRWAAKYDHKHIGTFDTEEQAAQAYDDYVRTLSSEFHTFNFPREGERCAALDLKSWLLATGKFEVLT